MIKQQFKVDVNTMKQQVSKGVCNFVYYIKGLLAKKLVHAKKNLSWLSNKLNFRKILLCLLAPPGALGGVTV